MKKLKCIIVDDDALSRETLRNLIGNHDGLRLIGTYHNALEGKMGLVKNEVDLMFLDVEMPEMTGFELLDDFKRIPQVVMVTAEKKYAFEAFEYDVTDFLSKPLETQRFQKAIEKVFYYNDNLTQTVEDLNIVFKCNGALVKLACGKIDYIEAMGDYIKVVAGDDSYVVHSTMKAFIAQLPDAFLRVHKSYIVNLDKVDRFNSKNVEVGAYEIPLSRNKKTQLVDALNNI